MKKSQANQTTAKNFEEKFDRGEDVLDYFDPRKARLVGPQSKKNGKQKFPHPIKQSSRRTAVVREKSARDPKKIGNAPRREQNAIATADLGSEHALIRAQRFHAWTREYTKV